MVRAHTPHKKRLSAWTNPWLIAIAFLLALIGLPMVLWLMTYHSDAAVAMFIITWVSLSVFVLFMAKKSVNDAKYYVDRGALAQTRREIETERQKQQRVMLKNEIEVLDRGEKTPVLDIWRLDTSLSVRHPYFNAVEVLTLDPRMRELHIRIQIGELEQDERRQSSVEKTIMGDIASYVRIIVRDPYLQLLTKYFDRIALQIDSLREDERHVDQAFPVASVLADFSKLKARASGPEFSADHLATASEVRYDGGREVVPHRTIDLGAGSGSK